MGDEDRAAPSPVDLEDEIDAAIRGDNEPAPDGSSLAADVAALVEDGKTLIEAEIGFQRTRLAFAANRSKSALLSGIFALAFVHLALIALVVGLVIALTPYVTAFGATAIVVGVLMLGAFLLLRRLQISTREIGEAFDSQGDDGEASK